MSQSQAIAMTGTAWGGDCRNTRSRRRKLAHDYLVWCGIARRSPESRAMAHQTWRGRVPGVCLGRSRGALTWTPTYLCHLSLKEGDRFGQGGRQLHPLDRSDFHRRARQSRTDARPVDLEQRSTRHTGCAAPNVAISATRVLVAGVAPFMGQAKRVPPSILQTTL